MSWETIRDIGLMSFVCGSFALFAVTLSRCLDPSKPDEWVQSLSDTWIWSIGDRMMLIGACLAVSGMFFGYLTSMRTEGGLGRAEWVACAAMRLMILSRTSTSLRSDHYP